MAPLIGIASSPFIFSFLEEFPSSADFVEIPFEQLQFDSSLARIKEYVPIILHCASLSIGGTVLPSKQTISNINRWIACTDTPWLGEHLAFLTAKPLDYKRRKKGQGPLNLGYTVTPEMNKRSISRIVARYKKLKEIIDAPIILENSPLYFDLPGTTMSQIDFIGSVLEGCDTGFLLDLTHFYITSMNMGFDAKEQVCHLPLDRIVEIHISGHSYQENMYWDDHASPASDGIFELLELVMKNAEPKAITFEYNWASNFPILRIIEDIQRARRVCAENIH